MAGEYIIPNGAHAIRVGGARAASNSGAAAAAGSAAAARGAKREPMEFFVGRRRRGMRDNALD